MAEAKTNIRTTVTLTLSEIEAQVIMVLTNRVLGSPGSYDNEAAAVFKALENAGVKVNPLIDDRLIGSMLKFEPGRPYEVS